MIMGLVTETRLSNLASQKVKTDSKTEPKEDNSSQNKLNEKTTLLEDDDSDKEKIDVSLMIIARKEVERMGSRFYSRGIDTKGNVSNFAETEQILRIRKPGRNIFIFVRLFQK